MRTILTIIFSLILSLHQIEGSFSPSTSYKPKVSVNVEGEKENAIIKTTNFSQLVSFKENVITLKSEVINPTNIYLRHSYYVGFV